MSVYVLPPCPDSCAGLMPEPRFDECAPETHFGEIAKMVVGRANANPLTNPEDAAEWAARFALPIADANALRELTVVGEKPVPEKTEQQISGDRTVYGFKRHTVTFEVDETNDENYEMLRFFECNNKYKLWYITAEGVGYGGADGVEGNVTLDDMIPRSREELNKFMGDFKWKSKFHPDRFTYPLI
jgi:hypothetical protein